jgi:hypothetical protein
MLLLASTSDLLRVVSSSTSALDVQASCMDLAASPSTDRPTGHRQNTAITAATTTTVVSSPAASVIRTVKTLSVRNRGVGTQVVTILHSDGTTTVEVIEASLAPDWALHYHESAGWWVMDNQGRAIVVNSPNAGVPVVGDDNITRLTADVINNNATANTIQDVTGLSFPVLAAKLYWFEFWIVYTAAATTTGSRWTISGPAAPTYLGYQSWYALTATTRTENNFLQAYDQPAASNASSATTGNNEAFMFGVIQPSVDGTVIARFASEVASSAITAKVNSFVRYRQITP